MEGKGVIMLRKSVKKRGSDGRDSVEWVLVRVRVSLERVVKVYEWWSLLWWW